jgi:hypothetical protein
MASGGGADSQAGGRPPLSPKVKGGLPIAGETARARDQDRFRDGDEQTGGEKESSE